MLDQLHTKERVVSLTFDDWGSDETITAILDILEKEQVPATFFLRANGAEQHPSLARAMLEGGHEVANHTYVHPDVTTLSDEALQEEIVRAHRAITEAIQQKPTMLFRPPFGRADERTAKMIAATGYNVLAMYDVTTFDWDTDVSAAEIVEVIRSKTVDGSVVLLHILDGLSMTEALAIRRMAAWNFAMVE